MFANMAEITCSKGKKMTNNQKKQIYDLISALSTDDRKEIMQFLSFTESNTALVETIKEIGQRRNSSGYRCPYCNCSTVSRYGTYRNRQRYYCKECKKTFTDLSLSCLHYIHSKEKFFSAAALMLGGATVDAHALKYVALITKIQASLGINYHSPTY